MAVIGTFRVNVVHPSSSGSSFALPGQGLPPSWCATDYTVRVEVEDNLAVYATVESGHVYDPVNPATYNVTFGISTQSGGWNWSGGTLVYPAGYKEIARATVDASNGYFDWYIANNANRVYVAQLTDLGWSPEAPNDAYLWVSGTGTYTMTDGALYPTPVRITISGIRVLIDYFPLAIRKSSVWESCNRSGGSVAIRKSSAWRNAKNSGSDSSGDNTVFRRVSSNFNTKAPKIGNNA